MCNKHSGLFTRLIDKDRVIHDKWVEEASKTNFEIVGAPKSIQYPASQNYLEYRCKVCGNLEDMQITHIRRNNTRCLVCQENEYHQAASDRGLELLGASDKGVGWRKLKIKACGHVGDWRLNVFHQYGVWDKCKECFKEKCTTDAESHGLEYLGEFENCGASRKYRFNDCGHEKVATPQQVERGAVECKVCINEEYQQMAAEVGLELIGPSSIPRHATRQFKLPCGCLKDLRLDHARRGSYLCEFCDDTHYVKPSSVYLIRFDHPDFSWLKLGYAKNIVTRSQNYGILKGTVETILAVVPYSTGSLAQCAELALHYKFKNHRLSKKMMEAFMTSNGHTECYPITIESELIAELEKLIGN
jgi:hypothetical protein